MLTFGEALRVGFARQLSFHGRSGKREFWCFIPFPLTVLFGSMIFNISLIALGFDPTKTVYVVCLKMSALIYVLTLVVVGFALARRLKDCEYSPLIAIAAIVPLFLIGLLIVALQEGTRGPNEYGEDPESPGFYDRFLKRDGG